MNPLFAFFAVALLVEGNPEAAADLNNQAAKFYTQARYGEAEQLYRQALDAAAQAGPDALRIRNITAGNLATLLRITGRYQEAERLLAGLVSQLQSDRTTPPLDLGRAIVNLAGLYQAHGDSTRAEAAALRARQVFAAHREIPVLERTNLSLILAAIHVDQHRYSDAEAILQGTLETVEGSQAVVAHNGLAAIAIARGAFADAERYSRAALERARTSLPETHPNNAMVFNNLAQACRFQEKYLDAEINYRRAIEIWERVGGPSHPDLAKGLMNLAAFYHERGREAGAEDLYVRSAAILERAFGPHSALALVVRNELADVLRGQRRFAESERLGRASIAEMEKLFGDDDPRLARALANRARLLAETKRPTEAAAVLARLRK